jgi:hypothetical protein
VQSNADVFFEDVGTPHVAGLRLVVSYLREDPVDTGYRQRWYGIVANTGPSTACGVKAEISLRDGEGRTRASFFGNAYSNVYALRGDTTIRCIPSGEDALFFAETSGSEPLLRGEAHSVAYSLDGVDGTGLPLDAAAPIVLGQVITNPDGSESVVGSVTVSRDIEAPTLWVFAIDALGFPVERMTIYRSERLASGVEWTFEAPIPGAGRIASTRAFVSFVPAVGGTSN